VKALRKAMGRPEVACALISLLTLGALLGMRAGGWLQRPELIAYDDFVRRRADREAATDPRIVICGMTEEDLVKYGHPLDDATLATLLEKIAAAKPCVVGLDIYRDLAEPRSGEFYPKFAETLARLEQVIAIERIPTIKPPPALADRPDRVAPNNLPSDYQVDGVYRRAYLFLEDGLAEPRECFALALARTYLATHGVEATLIDGPGGGGPLLQLGRTAFPRLPPDAGGYVGLAVRDYEILVDFRAPQRYRTFSFGDVLENRVPAGAIEDAIVIVGVTSGSVKDSNPTPVNGDVRGPIQHAMIVNQFLRSALNGEPPTGWWPELAEIAWIGLCTLLGGTLGLVLRSPWKLAPALALLLGAIVFAGWEALRHALWIPVATPALGAFAAATFVTSFAVFLERSDRRVMQALFSRHVSTKVADALWAVREQFLDGGRLKPQRLTATVLFTDLKGFSTISEDMDPASLMNWINEYMNGVARHVDAHDGMVNSYIGDAIMAVFGAPVARTREEDIDQDAINAVECALAMRRELKELNAGWAVRGMPTVAMRVGIFTGPLVAGSIGSVQRLEFTVLGDTTNTAARLEGAGKDVEVDETTAVCTILIGDATWQRLHGRFTTKLIGPISLKGKARPVIVHSVLCEAPRIPPR
jgi:adenylate cyclase